MTAKLAHLSYDIKEEGLCIILECFMIQEELCQITDILAVNLLLLSIHFEHGYHYILLLRAINLIPWRKARLALD